MNSRKKNLGNNNMLKFYRTASTEKEYLYAAVPENDMTFLAVEGKGDNAAAAAEMTVIPTTEAGVLMPQYFYCSQCGGTSWYNRLLW